ncbi:MAG: hypothetical protein ABIP74_02450 [Candidatus Saccharimonas sp.]
MLQYKELRRQFLDITDITPDDRVKVTLKNGDVVYLKSSDYSVSSFTNLVIDISMTDWDVVRPLIELAMANRKHSSRGSGFHKQYPPEFASPEEAAPHYTLGLDVREEDDDSWDDNSPRVGEYLYVHVLLEQWGGSGTQFDSPIANVEFVTI